MSNYTVKLTRAPKGHEIPPLLADVGAFVAKQKHGSLGWFDALAAEAIPKEWMSEKTAQLQKSGFAFLHLPEGSMLALVNGAVALLGSEGDARTVANSLEEFLLLWSKGDTEIDDLDDEDGSSGRKALAAWLKDKKVKAPKAKSFDFLAWLEGETVAKPAPVKAAKREVTAAMKELGPKAKALAAVMGMRADAPEVEAYVVKTLGKKVPASTTARNDSVNVSAPKAGVELVFSHDVLREDYPPIAKGKTFIPYISHAWLNEKMGEAVLGVPWKAASAEEVEKVLGKPTSMRKLIVTDKKPTVHCWTRDLGGGIELEISFRKFVRAEMTIASANYLEEFPDNSAKVFLGWAALNGLLDESQFPKDVLKAVKERKAAPGDLMPARGLWNTHLKDKPELRETAYLWFHNFSNLWITKDLKTVFGKRVGPHGHDEPKIDDPNWAAVDKAAKSFAKTFAQWLK
jgi:hypothetical protein